MAPLLVQPGIVDGHRGPVGQVPGELQVGLGEPSPRLGRGEGDGPQRPAPDDQRDDHRRAHAEAPRELETLWVVDLLLEELVGKVTVEFGLPRRDHP